MSNSSLKSKRPIRLTIPMPPLIENDSTVSTTMINYKIITNPLRAIDTPITALPPNLSACGNAPNDVTKIFGFASTDLIQNNGKMNCLNSLKPTTTYSTKKPNQNVCL